MSWLLVASVGFCWRVVACGCLWWLSVVSARFRWLLVASGGLWLLVVACVSSCWLLVALGYSYHIRWPSVAIRGKGLETSLPVSAATRFDIDGL